MLHQQVGELRYREDVDQVEEQLQGHDLSLAPAAGSQYPGSSKTLHRVNPFDISPLQDWLYFRTGG
jgi:hypothetical protein